MANGNGALLVKPTSDKEAALTFFWADNFDMKVETQTWKGSIHPTHMVAFQELSQMPVITKKKVELERIKQRTLEKSETEARNISVDPKKEPTCILDSVHPQETNFDTFPEEKEHLMWMMFRKLNAADQIFPSFAAWKTQVRTSNCLNPVQKTVVTHLYIFLLR